MKIIEISHCNKWLGFKNEMRTSSHLPALVWNQIILCGSKDSRYGLELNSQGAIEPLLPEIFGDLSLAELFLLKNSLDEQQLSYKLEALVRSFQFHFNEDVQKLAQVFASMPFDIKKWLAEKKLNLRDLQPFLSLSHIEPVDADLRKLLPLQMTHAEAVQIIELVIELKLMNDRFRLSELKFDSTSHLLSELKKLRHPMTHEKLESQKNLVQDLPWPRKLTARVSRQGDQAGIEVKFFSHSRVEFKKNIDGLIEVAQKLEQQNIERF